SVARLAAADRRIRFFLRRDPVAANLDDDVVAIEAGVPRRRVHRDFHDAAAVAARLHLDVAPPRASGLTLANDEAGGFEQARVVGGLAAFDVAAEEISREGAVTDLGHPRFRVGERVRMI